MDSVDGEYRAGHELLARGADRTLRNLVEHTPLHAVAHGAEPRYLLAGLGLLEYVTLSKQQALPAWLQPGADHMEIIQNLLAQACGEVDSTAQDGKTPLDLALLQADGAAVETLLAHGADFTMLTRAATTPLSLTSDAYTTAFDTTGPKFSKADWPIGEPVAFDPASVRRIDTQVRAALYDLGYFHARFQTQLSTPPANPSAELLLDIAELGPPGVIQAFEVVGNRRDSAPDILRYLGLAAGMSADQATLDRIQQALCASGRFLEQEVTLLAEPEGLVLSLALTDYPSATPLARTLTLEEQTFLRLRDTLETALTQGESLVIATDTAAGVVPSPSSPHTAPGCNWRL